MSLKKNSNCKLYFESESNGKTAQKIVIDLRARGFLQYMVRYIVGMALKYSNGGVTKQQFEDLLQKPDEKPTYVRGLAKAEGLVMKDCVFKEGNVSKEPIYIEEEDFLKSVKERFKKQGIEYILHDEDDDPLCGLFD